MTNNFEECWVNNKFDEGKFINWLCSSEDKKVEVFSQSNQEKIYDNQLSSEVRNEQ